MSRNRWLSVGTATLFVTTSFAGWFPAEQFPTGDVPFAVAEGDFNGDGHSDLATANARSDDVTVLLGQGDGTFATAGTYSAGDNPRCLAVGDFNGDGHADLVVPGSASRDLTVLLGNGDGTFTAGPAQPVTGSPRNVVVSDFDQDGIQDLVLGTAGANYVTVSMGNGDGTFLSAPRYNDLGPNPVLVAVGELTGDSVPDLVVVNNGPPPLMTVLEGQGDGWFLRIAANTAQVATHALTLSDFDRDGLLDVAFTTGINPWYPPELRVGLGLGEGIFRFAVHPLDFFPVDGIDAADLDRDGSVDLVVTGNGSAMVMSGQGDGTFATAVWHPLGADSGSVTHADFDEDGWLDLAGPNRNGVTILQSRGDGTFLSPNRYGDGDWAGDVDAADFDGDGRADLVTANTIGNSVSVLLDQGDGTFASTGSYSVKPDPSGNQGIHPVQAATGDFNGDGNMDVVTANEWSDDVTVLMGNGDGTLSTGTRFAVGSTPASVEVDDLDRNPYPDIVTVNAGSGSATVLRGRGDGRFVRRDFFAGYNLAFGTLGDFNGDTHPDLVTVSASPGKVFIVLGRGDGTFFHEWRSYIVGDGFEYVAVVDCDMNGHEDLVLTNPGQDQVMVLFGNGDGTFVVNTTFGVATPREVESVVIGGDGQVDPTRTGAYVGAKAFPGNATSAGPTYHAARPLAVEAGDVNGDGHVDLLTAGGYGTVAFLPGLGDGTFGDDLPYAASSGLTSLIVSDFDRDGWTDIAAGGGTPGVAIMLNRGPAHPRVEIDIKPGETPNSVNPRSRGVIPVAILGSAAFDAQDLDATTLRFGPNTAPIAHKKAHSEDVNDDGFMDLVTHFRTQETGIVCDDDHATLSGATFDGQTLEASDTIRTVGCRTDRGPGISFDQQRRHEEATDGPLREIRRQ